MKKLYASGVMALMYAILSSAQVGINTQTPQTTLDVNGSIQLRNELQVDGNPGTAGQIYFSQGNNPADLNDWKNVNVPFLEDGQYQLVNTYAVKDQVGIDFTGYTAPTFSCSNPIKEFPFTETFETSNQTHTCWTNQRVTGTSDWSQAAGDGYNSGGSGTVRYAHGGSGLNARFVTTNNRTTKYISPTFDLTNVSNPKLSFWYGQRANGGNQNQLKIYYRTTTGGAWSQVGLTPNSFTENISNWTQVTVDLPNKSATYQIAFEGISSGGRANVFDDVEVYGDSPVVVPITDKNYYNSALSTLNELITAKNWTIIPGLDLDIKINDSHNKISMIFQTGVESRTNPGNNTSAQTEGNIRYMCGIFRKLKTAPDNSAILVALRGDQINNAVGKENQLKAQSIYTLTYTVQDVPAEEYTFSVACRRLSLNLTGTGSEATSLLSIGNAVNGSGTGKTNDFMLNSVLKVDVIELVTVTGL